MDGGSALSGMSARNETCPLNFGASPGKRKDRTAEALPSARITTSLRALAPFANETVTPRDGRERAVVCLRHERGADHMPVALSLIVVFTIRSDNYERLQEAPELEGIQKIPFDLGPIRTEV